MKALHINYNFEWSAHREFLIYDKYGELLGETDSMTDALRTVGGGSDLHIITFSEDGYPVTIARL